MASALSQALEDVDDALHQKVRLAIMSVLVGVGERTFLQMREALSVSDGNLSTHLTTLERKGFVDIKKSFQGKKPVTSILATDFGKKAFEEYLSALERLVAEARSSQDANS